MSAKNCALALGIHVVSFVALWIYSLVAARAPEPVEVIDLTVIVNENLDGKEDEPPPLKNPTPPEPPKPKPKPEVVKKPDPPKALEQMVTNVVVKKEEKKPEKPEPPKKSREELLKERIDKMRRDAVVVKGKKVKIEVPNAQASADGRTARQTMSQAEILRKLNEGYRPGTENRIATSVEQRCLSLIRTALNEKWDAVSPKVGRAGTVLLSVRFNSSGGMIDVRISQSCGDAMSDAAALTVARQVSSIPGLDPVFIAQYRREPLTIRYSVRGE